MIPTVRNAIVGAITSIAALTGPAQGEERFLVFPVGNQGCGQFLQAVDAEHKARPRNASPTAMYTMEYLMYEFYAEGFLTGANYASRAEIGSSITDKFVGEMAWLENYCRQHPLDDYVNAVTHLRATLAVKEQQ
jgi:hypothetical protein